MQRALPIFFGIATVLVCLWMLRPVSGSDRTFSLAAGAIVAIYTTLKLRGTGARP